MNDFRELIDKYFNSLNESEGNVRRHLIEDIWAEDGKFVSPVGAVAGCAAIDAQINAFQKQFPGANVRRAGEIDRLDGKYLRFAFEAAGTDGAVFIRGVDFAIAAGGKLHLVAGFFDAATAPDAAD